MQGFLLKKAKKMAGWKKRWFGLAGPSLLYAKLQGVRGVPSSCQSAHSRQSAIHVKVDVKGASIAESSSKNMSNSFEIITAVERLILQAADRNEMDRWITALKTASVLQRARCPALMPGQSLDNPEDVDHNWYFPPLSKFKYCQICGQLCSAVRRGMACESLTAETRCHATKPPPVCRLHVHTRCVGSVHAPCKWASLDDVPPDQRTETVSDRNPATRVSLRQGGIFHQWTIGNFGSNSKCSVCKKSCGSSIRLQDYRCLWCKVTVHGVCRLATPSICTLGPHKVSILPPTALQLRKNAPAGLSHWIVCCLSSFRATHSGLTGRAAAKHEPAHCLCQSQERQQRRRQGDAHAQADPQPHASV